MPKKPGRSFVGGALSGKRKGLGDPLPISFGLPKAVVANPLGILGVAARKGVRKGKRGKRG